jgi:hypothetical protein
MKNIILIVVAALFVTFVSSCKTNINAQDNSKFDYNHLYKVWVVETVTVLGENAVNMETDKNEYRFKKEGVDPKRGVRITITPRASVEVPYTIEGGSIHFDPGAMFPLTKFDKEGNLVSSRDVSLPPYKIVVLTSSQLTLENDDILMKLKAK